MSSVIGFDDARAIAVGRGLAVAAALLIWLAAAGPVSADPPGGGTVTVDTLPIDGHGPHVGCAFAIDFFGFDAGADLFADVTFEAHPPTGRGVLLADRVFIGEDDASGGTSAAGLDAQRTYNLSAALQSFTPHPQQGFHVTLAVHADGSQRADTRQRVFWVSGCATPNSPPPPAAPRPPSGATLPSSGGPGVGTLPNTAGTAPAQLPLQLTGLALLLAGVSPAAAKAVRHTRSRRRFGASPMAWCSHAPLRAIPSRAGFSMPRPPLTSREPTAPHRATP